MKTKKTLQDLYSFPGFRAGSRLKGIMGDSLARIVTLVRRQKKRHAVHATRSRAASTTAILIESAIWTPAARASIWNSNIGGGTSGVVGGGRRKHPPRW